MQGSINRTGFHVVAPLRCAKLAPCCGLLRGECAIIDEPTEPSPLSEAQVRLSTLAVAGAPPARVTLEVGDLIAGWASEADMAGAAAQARIERLWDGFTRDASDLQEQISDAEGGGAMAPELAQRQLAALQAIVAALQAAHERLSGAEDVST